MSSNKIRSYSLAEVVNAANNSTIKIRHQTQNDFYMFYENSFLVLPDAKTVVGVDFSDRKKLMIEDITLRNPRQIGTHGDCIETVLFDSLTRSLLVGDVNGHVRQYKKEKESFTMVKDYGDVGVGVVYSSTQVGRYAIFGGDKNSLVAIDVSEQRVCAGYLKSSFEWTFSLQICEGVGSNVYLSLGGEYAKYFLNPSDFLDVTRLYNRQKKHSSKVPKKKFKQMLYSKKKIN